MSGYPLYAPVHKGLCLALGNLSNHISKMNVENQDTVDAFVKEFECVAGILHSHAENEDTEIEPTVKKVNESITEAIASKVPPHHLMEYFHLCKMDFFSGLEPSQRFNLITIIISLISLLSPPRISLSVSFWLIIQSQNKIHQHILIFSHRFDIHHFVLPMPVASNGTKLYG